MTGILLFCSTAFSQNDSAFALQLRSGAFIPQRNVFPESVQQLSRTMQKVSGKSFAVLQFNKVPSITQRMELTAAGIELLDYIPGGAYTVSINRTIDYNLLNSVNARAVFQLRPEQKMHPKMAKGIYPSWAVKSPGMIDVWVSFPKTLSFEEIRKLLSERNFNVVSDLYKDFHVVGLKIAIPRINELASLPFIQYVEPAPHGDQPLNLESKNNSRANVLQAAAATGGLDLKGEGVTIGVGDNSDPHYHLDLTGRIINRAAAGHNYHGTHVTGTVGGAGITYQGFEGYAPKSTIISQVYSGILQYASAYVTDHHMVVTNNSYGDILSDCDYAGTYDLISYIIDQQAFSLPNLQHVFAAGNDGTLSCPPYPSFFKTVAGSYQAAKNVITVGATTSTGNIASFSSRGPVKDGRTKPEIMANGSSVKSTIPWNTLGGSSGTSMAAPAVTGGLALLYNYYRNLNSGADPKSGLMKALICNGSTDLGNNGPDFTYGFGWMNLLRSADMLKNNHYFISSISNGGINTHTISSVPAGTAQLKIMLYWHDPAAAPFATQTLVNDLDLSVTSPSTVLPWKLDTLPANVNNSATAAADHINNIEQITIDNPSGSYTVTINGTSVPVSSQEYFLVYDIIPTETRIVYPVGRESLVPGEPAIIQWESYGSPANTFTIEYSTDDGSNWTIIDAAVAANLRQFTWTVSNTVTNKAKIRVSRNGTGYTSTSNAFTICGIPTLSLASTQCEGYFAFNWTAVTGATDYEVLKLTGDQLASVAYTTDTNYILSGLSRDTGYFVVVRARIGDSLGIRSIPLSYTPNAGTCSGSISDNDLMLDSIIAPLSGRLLTSTALTATTQIKARIKNLDDVSATSFKMRYSLDGGGSWVEENVSTIVLPGATYTHTFATTADFLVPGNYDLRVEVINMAAADPVSSNNLSIRTIKQLNNSPVDLTSIFLDNFETATNEDYIHSYTGLNGIERYDFTNSISWGRARTFLNTGIAYSGSKAITLDFDGNYSSGTRNFLYGTYNLASYNTTSNDIRLDFHYKNHGQTYDPSNPYNKVWIRGNDTAPWIEVYDLFANQNDPGTYKKTSSIEVSDLLVAAGQSFSTSFQVRWGQYGHILAADNEGGEGYTFDDIRLYEAIDDIQLISIDTPVFNSCGLSSTVPVRVIIRNASTNTISNIPVRLVVDGGTPVIETFAGPLGPDASASFTFTATANLAALGTHTVLVNVQYATDNFKDNDTATLTIINNPVINSFPYIENFESGSGNWYSGGTISSWEYGVPSSVKINRAASGTKAWKTRLEGSHNSLETSYLYSPCFDLTGMTNPTLSFNIALDLENCGGTYCDGAYIEYSSDGLNWTRLGTTGTGTNWYNKNYGSGNVLWSVENYTRWHVVTNALPTGINRLRLRIVMESDPYVNYEGVGVDDIHIYDNTMGMYSGSTMSSPVKEKITGGTNWVNFTSGGKLVASIQPNNQNMDSVAVQAYINTGSVRNDGRQYYHDRNITIKPVNRGPYADSVIVRFYFKDRETERLINATGCTNCTKPAMAAELGVTKYSDPDESIENGDLTDDVVGSRIFLSPEWNYKVPFDSGYYVEYKVLDFSEFWLSDGWLDGQTALPVKLLSFTAQKKNDNDVLAEWKTASENNVNHFEIEVAKGNADYQDRRFVKIGEVTSQGNSTGEQNYSFTDTEAGKSGARYYRLKIVDKDNTFAYSPVRVIVFSDGIEMQIYPNPSAGKFQLIYQLNDGETMTVNLYNINGKLMKQLKPTGNGFVQKSIIDLSSPVYASGIYLLKVEKGGSLRQFKLIKQ